MKNGRKLTVAERNWLKTLRFNTDNWLICKKLNDEWHIVNRQSQKVRIIPAP
jgi:hypothetical protein